MELAEMKAPPKSPISIERALKPFTSVVGVVLLEFEDEFVLISIPNLFLWLIIFSNYTIGIFAWKITYLIRCQLVVLIV